MPLVKAIHEIHRKSEVVQVGETFTATDAEYTYLIGVGAAIDAAADAEPAKKVAKAKKDAVADDNGLDGLE